MLHLAKDRAREVIARSDAYFEMPLPDPFSVMVPMNLNRTAPDVSIRPNFDRVIDRRPA